MRFLDVKTDYAFKRVFGAEDSKPILISFLNAILEYEGDAAIVDLTIVDPYQIPMLQGMKDTYVDVKAVLASGRQVIIEMQVLNVAGFEQRILHNAAKQYATQLDKGENYTLLNPVIALTFTDFGMFEGQAEYISRFRLLERERFIEYGDDVELIFVELPKFRKEAEELETIQDKWIYFVKNAGKLDCVPHALETELPIQAAFAHINEAGMTREELELQHKRHDFIILQRGSIEKGYADGEAKGRAEGEARGRTEGREAERHALILQAYKNGMPTNLIGDFVGMTEEEVIALLRRLL